MTATAEVVGEANTVRGRGVAVLAFSGGLDTSYCLHHLRKQGWDVVTVTVDTGGFDAEGLREIEARAHELGATRHVVIDARQRLWDDFVANLVQANFLRGGVYPSCAGAERVVVAEEAVKLAISLGADAIAHGSTGAGNDHVRFDVTIRSISPGIRIITPVRDGELSREAEAAELTAAGFGVDAPVAAYSINEGMVGVTIGGAETGGSWEYLPDALWRTTAALRAAPDRGTEMVIDFDAGLPVALHGEAIAPHDGAWTGPEILTTAARVAAGHGVGRGMHLGTTIMGLKARIAFEAPAMLVLIAAHRELERLTLTARQLQVKDNLGSTYGDLLHEGLYSDPIMRDIEAFLASSQRRVTGAVRVHLVKGNIVVLGSRSPFSLLESGIRLGYTYGEGSTLWTGEEARAFAKMYGLGAQIAGTADPGTMP